MKFAVFICMLWACSEPPPPPIYRQSNWKFFKCSDGIKEIEVCWEANLEDLQKELTTKAKNPVTCFSVDVPGNCEFVTSKWSWPK